MSRRPKDQIDVERHRHKGFVIYEVSGDDLDSIESQAGSVGEDFGFATAGSGVFVSMLVTLLTVDIKDTKTFAVFVCVTLVAFFVTAYCGRRWWRQRKNIESIVTRIKQKAGPLGEEGDEISEEDLNELSQETSVAGKSS